MPEIGECKVDLADDLDYMIRDRGVAICRLSAEVFDEELNAWFCRRHSRPEFEGARRASTSVGDAATGTKRL